MTWRTEERRSFLPLLLTFLLGLFIGWWVIGWWLWPVTYSNALPQDLRPDEKGQYLAMVAESYAATGDLATAQRRIETWPRDQLAQDITTVQGRLAAGNPVAASQLQRLAPARNVPAAAARPQAAPTARPPQTASSPLPALTGTLRQVCVGAIWVVVLLLGIAAIAWLWRQWQLRSGRRSAGGPGQAPDLTAPYRSPSVDAGPGDIAEQEQSRWEAVGDTMGEAARDDFGDLSPAPYAPQPAARPPAVESASPMGAAAPAMRAASLIAGDLGRTPAAAVPAPAQLAPIHVDEFLASYHAGEPDYDEAFDVKDEAGVVVGQCGMSLMMPIGRGSDQAAALQVWLWEERDQYTQVKVLMSDSAYRDTALRDQLAEENPAIPIRQGSEFDLETHRLILHGTVEKILYDEQDAGRIFSYLAVRLQVAQR